MNDSNVTMSNLVAMSANGLDIASFNQIRQALITEFKNIYGSDIDTSTGTADGIFIYKVAQMMSNTLSSLADMYASFDINNASGRTLDILVGLSGISRHQATKSIAYIDVTNQSEIDLSYTMPAFLDKSGLTWTYNSVLLIPAGETVHIAVSCNKYGAVAAPEDWIISCIDDSTLVINQENAAILGRDRETDAELRQRHMMSASLSGLTILQSLKAAIMQTGNVKDVQIVENNTNILTTANDDTIIQPHSIYIIIRRNGTILDNNALAELIYNKLTPGVFTNRFTGTNGVQAYGTVTQSARGITLATERIDWKEATPISNASITATMTTYTGFNIAKSKDAILTAIQTYFDDILPLGETPSAATLASIIQSADPKYLGNKTYDVNECYPSYNLVVNPNTYYTFNTALITGSGNSYNIVVYTTSQGA